MLEMTPKMLLKFRLYMEADSQILARTKALELCMYISRICAHKCNSILYRENKSVYWLHAITVSL